MKALILAAGFGTRLSPYTHYTPKPLFTIGGRPLLDRIIRDLEAVGCEAVFINTHHFHQQIEDFIASRHYSVPVLTRYEPRILGAGGAIRNLVDFWDERPFFVINSDIVFSIDLKHLYRFHRKHAQLATLALCDDPRFNSVCADANGWIAGFENRTPETGKSPYTILTFTGIQVVDPHLLRFIPEHIFFNVIDAYRAALSSGFKIKAFFIKKNCWTDVGTPESYIEAAVAQMAPAAFQIAFHGAPQEKMERIALEGGGSDRKWLRLSTPAGSVVLAQHGIFRGISPSEVDSFVSIGVHLKAVGAPVPEIYHYDLFSGLVFLEDLGDILLQKIILDADCIGKVVSWYERVIDALIRMSLAAAQGFDTAWTHQTPCYDRTLLLEKECGYFVDAFLVGWLGMGESAERIFDSLKDEFELLADRALEHAVMGFMHRDMQSRNIMVKEDRFYFIDFQGGRIGPIQYDLASLLIDPYVNLSETIVRRLTGYATRRLSSHIQFDEKNFRMGLEYCAIARNLQILGAFGYLSRVKRKQGFEHYIPAAVRTLNRLLTAAEGNPFPRLSSLVEKIEREKL